tara:strand:- start:325 stop:1506 length:1182 start_codon:yes stop_codon:yes gene_type:complete
MNYLGTSWTDLTTLDKENHVNPFIEYITNLIKIQKEDTSQKYIVYISIGANPESIELEGLSDEVEYRHSLDLGKLFPDLLVEKNTKIYYIGIDIFTNLTKIINQTSDLINVALFYMYWIDDCPKLISTIKKLVDFNSTNDMCIGTICGNFAKFRLTHLAPKFPELANIFPKLLPPDTKSKTTRNVNDNMFNLINQIKERKAVYFQSVGYFNIKRGNVWEEKSVVNHITAAEYINNIVTLYDDVSANFKTYSRKKDTSYSVVVSRYFNTIAFLLEIINDEDYLEGDILIPIFNLEYPFGFNDLDINGGDTKEVYSIIQEELHLTSKEDIFIDIEDGQIIMPGDYVKAENLPMVTSTKKGGYYDKIINPNSGIKVSIYSRLGYNILAQYLDLLTK